MDMTVADLYYVTRHLSATIDRHLGVPAVRDPREGLHRRTILRDVVESPGSTVGEVAERLHVAQSIVSKTIARARDQGLFETHVDPDDHRRTRVHPTKQLELRYAEPLAERSAAVLGPLTDGLSSSDREALDRALAHLHTRFKTEERERQ